MTDRIFSAEQIKVPLELPLMLKDFTKEVLRADPSHGKEGDEARNMIAAWAVNYFQSLKSK